jgi:hypothetical protein
MRLYQDNQRLPGLKQLSQFPDFQMNRQYNTDFQGALMGYGRIIIKTSDTDVIVLCIYFDKQMTNISELWVQMGNVSSVKDGRKFLPTSLLGSPKLSKS